MEVIKTQEQLTSTNQKDKKELVQDLTDNFNISEAFKVMEYDGKRFIGFMGHMITKPTDDISLVDNYIEQLDPIQWEILLNVITVLVKERKVVDDFNYKKQ